jgi:hypothetical protein
MSSDPGNGAGDSGDDDLEERKTRLVPRPTLWIVRRPARKLQR